MVRLLAVVAIILALLAMVRAAASVCAAANGTNADGAYPLGGPKQPIDSRRCDPMSVRGQQRTLMPPGVCRGSVSITVKDVTQAEFAAGLLHFSTLAPCAGEFEQKE